MNGAGTTIELSTDWCASGSKSAKCTINSGSWTGYGENSPSTFIGSTINFQLDYKASTNCQFIAMYQLNGNWVYDKTINVQGGIGQIKDSMTIPSSATGFRLRFTGFSTDEIVYVDNWILY